MTQARKREKSPHIPLKAVIRGIRNEAPGVNTYLLEPVEEYLAGGPGQFNMLGWPGVGEAPVSLSRVPAGDSPFFEHTIRAAGRVTTFLSGFEEGDEFFLRGPFGRGWPIEEAMGKHLLLITGGLGLAPLKPVIELAPVLGATRVTLLHGARTPEDMIFKDELARWASARWSSENKTNITVELTVDKPDERWKSHSGLITGIIRPLHIDPAQTVAFICGPEIMMRFSARELILRGMEGSNIHVSVERRMKCGTGHCGHCQLGIWFACKDGPVFSYGQLKGLPDVIL